MQMIQWKDSFSVNIAEIDEQHKVLVGMLNQLHQAMQRGEGKQAVGKIIAGLSDYAKTHFKTEEDYFDQFNYSDSAKHKQEHAQFSEKIRQFQSDLEAGGVTLSIQVITFLSDWLYRHIVGSDKEYSQFFQDHGLR